jgi:DNA-binding NtrC family response regulator
MTHYVLIVDADARAGDALRQALGDERYAVHRARDLDSAEALIASVLHAVVIVGTSLLASEDRERAFVHFVRSHSASTRVLLLRELAMRGSDLRDYLNADAVLPRSAAPHVLAQVVDQLVGTR